MAENPQKPTIHARPLSPHLQIYRWSPTMASSITHRVTGMGMAAGMVLIAWWLIATASGPGSYAPFAMVATSVFGQIVLLGFAWALSFHLLNGIRHLTWDVGYGFNPKSAKVVSSAIYALSIVIAVGVFVFAHAQQWGLMQ
jgi:succinate dehydrogenase / fumarate reductase cytochrome b subunit